MCQQQRQAAAQKDYNKINLAEKPQPEKKRRQKELAPFPPLPPEKQQIEPGKPAEKARHDRTPIMHRHEKIGRIQPQQRPGDQRGWQAQQPVRP